MSKLSLLLVFCVLAVSSSAYCRVKFGTISNPLIYKATISSAKDPSYRLQASFKAGGTYYYSASIWALNENVSVESLRIRDLNPNEDTLMSLCADYADAPHTITSNLRVFNRHYIAIRFSNEAPSTGPQTVVVYGTNDLSSCRQLQEHLYTGSSRPNLDPTRFGFSQIGTLVLEGGRPEVVPPTGNDHF